MPLVVSCGLLVISWWCPRGIGGDGGRARRGGSAIFLRGACALCVVFYCLGVHAGTR